MNAVWSEVPSRRFAPLKNLNIDLWRGGTTAMHQNSIAYIRD
jgi:hypothetical protein